MNEQISHWDEVRTAYHVARLGTLSAAAAHLGVHHATVIRHIDALEARLGCKLFLRHPRGYRPTDAGEDLRIVAAGVEDRLAQLAGRLMGQRLDISGELIVTALSVLSPWLTPILAMFQNRHKDIRLNMVFDDRLMRLETGEAHIALRMGPKPQEPDNVVRRVRAFPVALFASVEYVARHGRMGGIAGIPGHRFIAASGPAAQTPAQQWLKAHVPTEAIAYRTSDMRNYNDAIRNGAGIGFMSPLGADRSMVRMMAPEPGWAADLWLVTHRDLTRMARVQALSTHILEAARGT